MHRQVNMKTGTELSRKRNPELAREIILETAEEIFARVGYEGARIDEIAAASGYNKRLLFYYFGDKERLYRAVIKRMRTLAHDMVAEALAPFVSNPYVTLDERLVRGFFVTLVECMTGYLSKHPDRLRLMGWECVAGWHPTSFQWLTESESAQFAHVIDFIRRAQQAGFLNKRLNAVTLLVSVASLCYSFTIFQPRYRVLLEAMQEQPSRADLERVQQDILQVLFEGILSPR
jgi:TetR/AcrR family transcriptional regulator